jgi:hypothetical protein
VESTKPKQWFFEKISNNDKNFYQQWKNLKLLILNEKKHVTTDPTDIENIIRTLLITLYQ